MNSKMKPVITFIILIFIAQFSFAQRRQNKKAKQPETQNQQEEKSASDTVLPPRTVVVTSQFAPSLKQTSKINFSAATPLPDSVRPTLQYNIPVQNLSFGYKSAALKAMAENIDSTVHWNNTSYLKAGYGNYSTPYLQAGLSFGDGVTSVLNVNGKYTSSNGSLPFQDYNKTHLEGIGIFASKDNKNEWTGNVFLDNSTQYEYGYQPDTLKFTKDDLKQVFTTFGGKVGLRNKTENRFGISYNPTISLDLFTDNHSGKENTFAFELPITKSITNILDFNVGLTGSVTSYNAPGVAIDNVIYYVTPSLTFKTPNVRIVGGFTPSWDNSTFNLLPNFTVDAKVNEEKFILQGGWIGYYNKTTYKSLANFNPWIQQPTVLNNALVKEQYAGFKGSGGDNFTYNARVSFLKITNQPLFINDDITGRSFQVVYEPSLNDIRLHGEVGYTAGEQFSLLAGATFNQYSSLSVNEKAYGLLPIEINGALRYQFLKDLLLKADVFFWDGTRYKTKAIQTGKLDPATDLNAGVEFSVLPNLNVWLQFNNILNDKYQRWNQYQVLGFNMLAGVVYSFGQLKMK